MITMQSWSNLPEDIRTLIFERLFYVDQIHSLAVCKGWRSINNTVKYADKFPWVMAYGREDGNAVCYLYDPTYKRKHRVGLKEIILNAEPRASKCGWVLFSKEEKSKYAALFFYNPFSAEIMDLPELHTDQQHGKTFDLIAASFSTSPVHPDCVIFVMSNCFNNYCVSTCSPGDGAWTSRFFIDHQYLGRIQDVAYMEGVFYCIFSKLESVLVAFEVSLQKLIIYLYPPDGPALDSCGYLIESDDGNIMLSRYDGLKRQLCVSKFDPVLMNWFEVESLDDRFLFRRRNALCLIDETSEPFNPKKVYRCFWNDDCFLTDNYFEKVWIEPPQLKL